ncbi:MAG TPA: protein kinase [Blastocatellia bacterium]|nr:protein kinase [Blastocatellia bacterium]
MTPERWQRIEQVYFAALARSPNERAAWLDQACRDDAALRAEVESLLAAHRQGGGFLAEPALEVVAKQLALEPSLAQAGQIINQYQILAPLGRGGMGVVYKALDLRLGRTVALKMLSPALVSDQTARLRFLREARAASMLAHPNICTVFEVGQKDELVYIAMQYVQGKTLADGLGESRLPLRVALGYALDIADALDEAHGQGVIHRDIKPTNIIINERGRAVVLDFGLAKYVGARRTLDGEAPTLLQITEEMSPIGTPAYMSPEQARGGRLDERSDIFSFGVMLYEMTTGQRPFSGHSQMDTLHAILYHDPPPPLAVNPAIPARLDRIIRQTIAKDPAVRYQSFADLKADLAALLAEKSGALPMPNSEPLAAATTSPNDPTITDEARSYRTAAGAAAMTGRILRPLLRPRNVMIVAAAALAVVAAYLAWRGRGSPSDAELIASLKLTELVNWKEQGYYTGADILGSISPDGKMIAYCSRSDGLGNIWIKQTSGGDPVQITKDSWHNWSPIWSPDGQELAYLSRRGQQTGIWRVPAFGGAAKLVATLAPLGGRLSRWSKDAKTIYYEADGNFFALDLSSGQSRALTEFDPQNLPAYDFSISPAEDRITYVESKDGQVDLWVTPLAGGSPTQITNDSAEDRPAFWHPDGRRILYSSKRDGVFQIFVAYMDGRKPVQLTFGDRDSFVSGISEDGTKLAVSSIRQDSDLWAVDVNTGEETQITTDVHAEMWADFSPDGRHIAYQFMRQHDDLMSSQVLLQATGTGEQQVELATTGIEPRWSPDGRTLAFLRLAGGIRQLWTINATGTGERQLTARGISGLNFTINPFNRAHSSEFSWSPDSRRMAFTTASAEPGIWVAAADGQNEIRTLPTPDADTAFYCPLWSPDGSRIAYLSITEMQTQVVWKVLTLATGQPTPRMLYQSNSVLRLLGWSATGHALVVATVAGKAKFASQPSAVGLFELATDTGGVRPIATAEAAYLYNNQLSADKRVIAIARHQDGKDNLWLYPISGGAPKKITSNNDSRLFFSSLTWSPDGKAITFAKQARFGVMSMLANYR